MTDSAFTANTSALFSINPSTALISTSMLRLKVAPIGISPATQVTVPKLSVHPTPAIKETFSGSSSTTVTTNASAGPVFVMLNV